MTTSVPAPRTRIFAAGLVVPLSAPSIRDGALLVENGRIAAIGPLREIGRDNPGVEIRYFPRCTIIPGAVNTAWTAEAARNSAREAIASGTTFITDSSPYGECLPQLAESGLAGIAYVEFFPFQFNTPEEAVDCIEKKVFDLREGLPSRVAVEMSVHALYTV
ncbi:MAG: hypothetical protein LC674_04130, partial [Actinobacteria bacterium]|nr:hypothetical protein [Actinomycetota bacterium]